MTNNSFDQGGIDGQTLPVAGRAARWARNAAVILTLTATVGTLGITSSFASGTTVPASVTSSKALSVAAAPAAVTSRLGAFDAALLKLVNAKRTAAGAVALREVVGLDDVSASWSTHITALGRYGKVVPNTGLASQTLSVAPTRGAFAQSVAKWYPQSVKVADVFALYAGYPAAVSNMTNKNYKFVGIRTAAAADGTSVATLTFTDTAIATQIVGASTVINPTGAVTSAVQTGATVALHGRAADGDAKQPLQVRVTDTVGAKVTTRITTVAAGAFAATVPLGFGTHSICTTVVNQGTGADLALGCITARLIPLAGSADTFSQSGTNLTGSGWGYEPASPKTAIQATVVLTGPSGKRVLTILANGNRPDLGRIYPAAGPTHGFGFTTPKFGKGVTTMCITLWPASRLSVGQKLACRSITVT